MSTDRTTEILNYLSAISREVGDMRKEMNARFTEIDTRLTRIEREQRLQVQRLDRIEGMLLTTRSEIGELQDRMTAVESKQS